MGTRTPEPPSGAHGSHVGHGHAVQDHHHGPADARPTAVPEPSKGEAVEWTCPMHPEIRQPGPGACPICGMALEPEFATTDSGPNQSAD